jgi:hypothetical protein
MADIPPGFAPNSPLQLERLSAATLAAWRSLEGAVSAVALVFVMPDGTVTASLAGDVEEHRAFSELLKHGPDVLRITIGRFIAGGGQTRIVPDPQSGN